MKVYRLERGGIGPFIMGTRRCGHIVRPSYFKKGDNPDTFVYGCHSIEALYEYFQETSINIEDRLKFNKYEIKEYNIPKRALRIREFNGIILEIAFPIFYLKREWKHAKDITDEFIRRDGKNFKPFSDSIDI